MFGDIVLGDVIVSVDGRPVANSADLYGALDDRRVGDKVSFITTRIQRNATRRTPLLSQRCTSIATASAAFTVVYDGLRSFECKGW